MTSEPLKFFHIVTCLWLMMLWFVSGQRVEAQTTSPQDKGSSARSLLEPLFANPWLFKPRSAISWKADEFGVVALPDEDTQHPEGVFRMKEISAVVWAVSPPRFDLRGTSEVRVLDPLSVPIPEEECRQRGIKVLEATFPWFFAQGALPLVKTRPPADKGLWSFQWKRFRDDELPDTAVDVQVRAIDGKVVSFGASKFVGEWEHKIKPSQAIQQTLEEASKNEDLSQIEVSSWTVSGAGGERYYHIELKALSRTRSHPVYNSAEVNAMSGALRFGMHGWQPAGNWHDPRFIVEDRLPMWTKQGLVFSSSRRLLAMPEWAKFPPQLVLQLPSRKLFHLTADLLPESFFSQIAGVSTASGFTLQRVGWTYFLDLNTGIYRVIGMPERLGGTPAIDPQGKWAVVFGTGRDRNTDLDLLPDDLTTRSVELGNRGRLVSKGNDHHPLFSPDNKWLYFITTTAEKDKVAHALRRIPSGLAHTKDVKWLKPEQIETLIPSLPSDAQRLSIFPNGQKLLLQAKNGMFALSIADKKATSIVLKNLKDAELGNAPITETRDGWAGPGDGEVTFSGMTTDKDGKVRWRIYSCRFDGSGLKAWTPKENEPVEAYKFPNAPDGKTAIDLAKEWALGEIKFEDYLRRIGR